MSHVVVNFKTLEALFLEWVLLFFFHLSASKDHFLPSLVWCGAYTLLQNRELSLMFNCSYVHISQLLFLSFFSLTVLYCFAHLFRCLKLLDCTLVLFSCLLWTTETTAQLPITNQLYFLIIQNAFLDSWSSQSPSPMPGTVQIQICLVLFFSDSGLGLMMAGQCGEIPLLFPDHSWESSRISTTRRPKSYNQSMVWVGRDSC